MNKKKLLKLATFLETKVPRRKFNMEFWGTTPQNAYSCGTAACALGWAGYIPAFKKEGLTTAPDEYGGVVTFSTPDGSKYCNFSAGREFFELTDDEAYNLFSPGNYPTNKRGPKSVAKRIREMVKKGGK